MHAVLIWIARLTGITGLLVMALAAFALLGGDYWMGGFQVVTILHVGMAVTLVACLAYFAAVVDAGSFTRAAERLGITKAVDRLWRFGIAGSLHLSRPFPRSLPGGTVPPR
jgi:hypothetical protein